MAFAASVLLRSEESGAQVAAIKMSVPPRWEGPPLHHHDFDEAFYVLSGELTFQIGDELITARSGDLAFAPRGVPHTFANRSDAAARFVLVCTPAGFERYFGRTAAKEAGEEPPGWAPRDIPEVTRVGPQIGG